MDSIYIRTVSPMHFVRVDRGNRCKCYKIMRKNGHFTIIDDQKPNQCYYFTNNDDSFDEDFDLNIKREICKLDKNGVNFLTQQFSHNLFDNKFDSDVVDRWMCLLLGVMIGIHFNHDEDFTAYMTKMRDVAAKNSVLQHSLLCKIANPRLFGDDNCAIATARKINQMLLRGDEAFFEIENLKLEKLALNKILCDGGHPVFPQKLEEISAKLQKIDMHITECKHTEKTYYGVAQKMVMNFERLSK